MKKIKRVSLVLVFVLLSISCQLFTGNVPNNTVNTPAVDFTTTAEPLNVTVTLDEASTVSGMFSTNGSAMTLTSADGTVFTLEVPKGALEVDTAITMTAVKSIAGAPLDSGDVFAVQLEPSGLVFNEILTLTITPAKEIPIKDQAIFGYEGSGQNYHLAMVDPKSMDIKIKLMKFSGAGVGSASDSAWAANLMIQASDASTRLWQKFGEYTQAERRAQIYGEVEGQDNSEFVTNAKATLDQFEDQVILKEIVAAELDCRNAIQALQDLLYLERIRQLLGFEEGTQNFGEKVDKLLKIAEECPAPYRIVGGLDDWQTDTAVCDIMKPFTLTGGGFTMNLSGGLSGTYDYTGPFNARGTGIYTISLPDGPGKPGTMTGSGAGSVADATNTGTEHYTLTPIEPCR